MPPDKEMKLCETCKWRSERGYCENQKIAEGLYTDKKLPLFQDMLVYSYDEGGSFWVGPKFGCIHHEGVVCTKT